MYIWYVCLRYYGQVPKIRTSPNPCNSIFNSKKMQGFGGTFHPANLQMLSLQNMVHLYPSVAKLISPAVMPSHVYIGSELSWCFGNSWSSRTSTWKQIQPNHTDQTTEIICKYPFLQKSSRTSNVSYSRFFCRKPNQHNQPTTLLICPLHACDFSDAVLCISCAVGSFGSIVMASNQSQNLRTHTHKSKTNWKQRRTLNDIDDVLCCLVTSNRVWFDMSCKVHTVQLGYIMHPIAKLLGEHCELSLYFSTCSSRVPLCASPSLDLRKPSRWKSAAQPRYSSRCSRSMAYKVKPFCLG